MDTATTDGQKIRAGNAAESENDTGIVLYQHAADADRITTELHQKHLNKIESTEFQWSDASTSSATELEWRETSHNDDQERLRMENMEDGGTFVVSSTLHAMELEE